MSATEFSKRDYLTERLDDIERTINQMTFMVENEDGVFYGDKVLRQQLIELMFEAAAARRALAELPDGN